QAYVHVLRHLHEGRQLVARQAEVVQVVFGQRIVLLDFVPALEKGLDAVEHGVPRRVPMREGCTLRASADFIWLKSLCRASSWMTKYRQAASSRAGSTSATMSIMMRFSSKSFGV